MTDITSLYKSEIEELCGQMGLPKYRAGQIFARLHAYSGGFESFTELPLALREELSRRFYIPKITVAETQVSKRDGTVKLLYAMGDGNCVEGVFMPYEHGNSVCISSQAGCAMACAFCASGIGGLARNLTASEMLYEVRLAEEETKKKAGSVVIMGTGEPLDNFDSVVRFIRLAGESAGLSVGQRHISVSTCGLCDRILQLAELRLGVTLSVSLHAATDEKRRKIMPVAKRWSVAEVASASAAYQKKTGRRVSFEYALIKGFNDTEGDAAALSALLKNSGSHVNIIRINTTEKGGFSPPSVEKTNWFVGELSKSGLNVTVRRRLGTDIDGACGQLRRKTLSLR